MQKNKFNNKHSFKIVSVLISFFEKLMLLAISAYQLYVSPYLGQNCKHYPSCSHFTKESLTTYGLIKGSILSSARIIRCNPWSLGGFDPVPEHVCYNKPSSFKLLGNYQTKLYQQQENQG